MKENLQKGKQHFRHEDKIFGKMKHTITAVVDLIDNDSFESLPGAESFEANFKAFQGKLRSYFVFQNNIDLKRAVDELAASKLKLRGEVYAACVTRYVCSGEFALEFSKCFHLEKEMCALSIPCLVDHLET